MKDEHVGYLFLGLAVLGLGGLIYFREFAPPPEQEGRGPIPALPELADLELNMDKVALGRRLYHDGILSGDGTVSCASCHDIEAGGAEARRTSFGIFGAVGPINSPTTLNTWNHVAQFWDGRAADLKEQAAGPVENPSEMGALFATVVPRVAEDTWYAPRFQAIYGADGVSKDTITDAIAEYERSLITPAPFDAYVNGDDEAISADAKAGYQLFASVGCVSCHNGPGVGGTMFQKMGVVHNYFEARGGELTAADMGRFNHTANEGDRHFFKVPTLRNVALTSPYFHDGSESNLNAAVRTMAHVQLGRELNDDEAGKITAFLETLTGQLPEHARLPEADVPPERWYEAPRAYDLRLAKRIGPRGATLFLSGAVPSEEAKASLIAMARSTDRRINVDGLVVDAAATAADPEKFRLGWDKVVAALAPLSVGHGDFLFSGAETKLCFAGEGNAAALASATEIMSQLPEGYTWSVPLSLYDFDAASQCDLNLGALQVQQKIEFVTGSARLNDQSLALVGAVAALAAQCPEAVRIQINGFTDDVGDEGSNLRLSRRRSESVRDALVRAGVVPSRLVSRGYGEANPIGDNTTEEGRAQNRRIELRLDRVDVAPEVKPVLMSVATPAVI